MSEDLIKNFEIVNNVIKVLYPSFFDNSSLQ